ncbi:MAG TPA: hypothetical protein VGC41_01335, partial [Kofleriaceae bacterium]
MEIRTCSRPAMSRRKSSGASSHASITTSRQSFQSFSDKHVEDSEFAQVMTDVGANILFGTPHAMWDTLMGNTTEGQA